MFRLQKMFRPQIISGDYVLIYISILTISNCETFAKEWPKTIRLFFGDASSQKKADPTDTKNAEAFRCYARISFREVWRVGAENFPRSEGEVSPLKIWKTALLAGWFLILEYLEFDPPKTLGSGLVADFCAVKQVKTFAGTFFNCPSVLPDFISR